MKTYFGFNFESFVFSAQIFEGNRIFRNNLTGFQIYYCHSAYRACLCYEYDCIQSKTSKLIVFSIKTLISVQGSNEGIPVNRVISRAMNRSIPRIIQCDEDYMTCMRYGENYDEWRHLMNSTVTHPPNGAVSRHQPSHTNELRIGV